MIDPSYHMAFKDYFEILFLPSKRYEFWLLGTQRCYGRYNVSRKSVNH